MALSGSNWTIPRLGFAAGVTGGVTGAGRFARAPKGGAGGWRSRPKDGGANAGRKSEAVVGRGSICCDARKSGQSF